MQIFSICPKSFASNTYLLISDSSAIVIDPSVSVNAINEKLSHCNAELKGILLTHGHFDHVISIDILRDRFDIPVYIHKEDACMLTDGHLNGFYTFFGKECVHRPADILLDDGDVIPLGEEKITLLHTPGHSKGSSCFIFNEDNAGVSLITGDTLFANSVGRCDLYGGDVQQMACSIKKLHSFDKKACIYPGHETSATLGHALDNVSYFFDF